MKSVRYLLPLLLAGCMVGPKYHQPEMAMPSHFSEAKAEEEYVTDEELSQWWKRFEDPFLNSLIEEAYTSNYDWRLALEQVVEARAQYKIQSSKLWPEVDLNASAIRSRTSPTLFASAGDPLADITSVSSAPISVFGPPVQNFFQVGFDAIWELDFFGKFRRGKKAAYYDWEASQDSAKNVLIIIISEVARDYVAICALQQKMEILRDTICVDEEELALTLCLFDAGLDSAIQVETLLATLENDQAQLPILESSFKQAVYALAVLLGRQPEGLLVEFEEIRPVPSGSNKVPIGLPSDLLRRRPDIQTVERKLAAATERIGVAVADLFPHISLTGTSYGYESSNMNQWIKSKSSFWSIGPTVNWNLIDFGRTWGYIDIANSLQRQARLNYEKTVISSLQDVEGSLTAYFEEEKRRYLLDKQYAANLRSYELTKDLYEAGLNDASQVLTAFKVVLETENLLVDSQRALSSDLIAVYKALGGDWECSYLP